MEINKKNRSELKSYFRKNAIPTETDFADLLDGVLTQRDDGIVKLPGEPLSIEGSGPPEGPKKVLNLYRDFADTAPAWTLSLNSTRGSGNAARVAGCFDLADGAGNSRLYIDAHSGNVGVGTTNPRNRLDVGATPRTGTHAEGSPLYVTGRIGASSGGIEFRHENGTQGIGFGYNTIYATGSNAKQNLSLLSRGDGSVVSIPGNLGIGGTASFGAKTRQMINLWRGDYGIGIQSGTQYFRTGANFAWYKGGVHSDAGLDPGTGGKPMMTLDGGGNLKVTGVLRANELRTTLYAAATTRAINLSASNKWGNFPDLAKTVTLAQATSVIVAYNVTMPGSGSHLCTRLVVDGKVQNASRSITGDTTYASPFGLWMGRLAAGRHTIVVQYRTPKGGQSNPRADWQNRSLQVLVFGG